MKVLVEKEEELIGGMVLVMKVDINEEIMSVNHWSQ